MALNILYVPLFLCLLHIATASDAETEDKYVEKGQSVVLKNTKENTEDIQWKNAEHICKMKNGKPTGNCVLGSIESDGSLTVKNTKEGSNNDYVLHNYKDGKLLIKKTYKLHVVDPIPKPNIQFNCTAKNAACNITYNKDLQFKWKLNGNDQAHMKSKIYPLPSVISQVTLTCIVSFKDIQKESDSTDIKCESLDLPVLPPTNRKRENPSKPHCNHPRSQTQPRTQTQTRPPPHQRCPPPTADQRINDEAEDHPPPRPRPRQKAPSYN
ncbi:uncharacterized protein LOC120522952 isoform X2 [Polypterus senegalus]